MYKRKLLPLALSALIATISHATVYTWTGSAGDGDWTNAGNWDSNGVPVGATGESYPSGLFFVNQSDDTIIFTGATAPSVNVPGLGGGTKSAESSYDTPILDIRSGGTFDFSMVGRETAIWRSSSAATDTIWTIGDGVGTNDVIVNLSGLRYINRNDGNTTTEILVNADATLNLNLTQNLDFSNHAVRPSKLTIAGGVVVVNQAVVDLEVAGNLIEFTELGGTFTANYGGQYADFAAIATAVTAGTYWGMSGAVTALEVTNNGGSFTVTATSGAGGPSVYTWTGSAGDGDWSNVGNWDSNGVPVDAVDDSDTTNGLGLTLTEGDSIVFDGANTPTSNFPGIGGGDVADASSPTMVFNSGGTFNLQMNSRESGIWNLTAASTRDVLTVGDGVGVDDVVLNLSGMSYTNRYLASTVRYVVNADGTLNFNTGVGDTLDLQNGSATDQNTQFIIQGGDIYVDGTITDLEVGNNLVEFTALGGTFTANYGGSYADDTAISNALVAGVYWKVSGDATGFELTDNGTSFTVTAIVATVEPSGPIYTWTGSAGDGDWTNASNWDSNGVPQDAVDDVDTTNGLGLTLTEGHSIVFDGANAPSSHFPGIGGGNTTDASTPTMIFNSGGTFNFQMNSRDSGVWNLTYGSTRDVLTVGDGVGIDDVVLNLSGIRSPHRYLASTVRYVVNSDGRLNFNSNFGGTIDFQQGSVTNQSIEFVIAGGAIEVDGTITDFEVGENRIEFTELGGTFTANYGGQYADFAAIQNAVNAEVYWVNDAGGLLRVEDNGTSYTVSAVTNVIAVTNSGFDLPVVLADGAVDVGVVDAWTESGGTIGVFNPSTSFYTNTNVTDSSGSGGILGDMDSPAALFFASDTDQTIIQTLTESIIVGETYALTVAIGDRDAGDRAGFAGYEISLLVDGVAVATRSSDVSPADGTFTDVVLVYTAQPGDSGVLGIRIGTSNAGVGKALDVDHVRLIYSDPPFIRIDTPQDRQIAQRDSAGQAQLSIDGTIWGAVGTEVQVRALAINGNGTDVDWVTLDAAPTDDAFTGGDPLTLDAGWYQLEVRLLDGATVLLEGVREHCGVGDIFITAGQSNSANFGQGTPSAADDRVSYLGLTNDRWIHADDPGPNPSGFAGTGGSPWPKLGDLLAAAHDVPIGFVQIGYGGSSVLSWTPAENDHYLNLKDAVETLGVNGFKAILWHQGERDAATSAALYAERLETVIAASRVDAGWQVPWGVALVSYTDVINPSTIEGQQLVIDDDPDVFAGAATDTLVGLPYRTGVHFLAAGLTAHAELWYDAINAFFPELTVADFSLSGTTATVSFTGLIGEAYAVEMRESLTVGDWLPAMNVASLGESPFSVDVNSPSDAAFFRVRHLLEPLAE